MSDVHVSGLPELNKFLQELPVKIERNILRGALRQGAKVIRAAAVQNVPVKSGELRRSLEAKNAIGTRSRGGIVMATVKARVFYAKFVEFGTKPHNIAAKHGGWLSFMNIFRKEIAHPGIVNPKPFMRPALDSQASAAVIAVGEKIKSRLTKEGLNVADVMVEGDE